MQEMIIEKNINEIVPDKNQPRKSISDEKIEEMKKSIISEGLINPIEIDEDNVIVTGEMRWRASILAGCKNIKCRIIKITGMDRFKRQVIENIHNNTMNPWDTALAIKKLLEKMSNSPGSIERDNKHKNNYHTKGYKELSNEIGMSEDKIREYLKILDLSKPLAEKVKENKLPRTIVRSLNVLNGEVKKKFEDKLLKNEIGNRDNAQIIARAINKNKDKVDEILTPDYSKMSKFEFDKELKKFEKNEQLSEFDVFQKNFNNVEKNILEVISWLEENEKKSIPQFNKVMLIKFLNDLTSCVEKWQRGEEINKIEIAGEVIN